MKIAFVMNPVAGGWSPLRPEEWGGGEEVAVNATTALAAAGHEVTVFYDGDDLEHAGVHYRGRPHAEPALFAFDVAVYFKAPEFGGWKLAKRQFLWTDQERAFDPDPFERVFVCSEYLGRVLAAMTPRCAKKLDFLPYGADRPSSVHMATGELAETKRDPYRVLHSASPDRGLEELLGLWPEVVARVPEATLRITYGWDLFDKYGGARAVKERIAARLATLSGVTMERVRADRMGEEYGRAGVWAYYCTGGEQFGLAACKAQLYGCVPVVKPWGALHETVATGKVPDKGAFLQRLVTVLDPAIQAEMRKTLPTEHILSWAQVAARWGEVFAAPPYVVEGTVSELRLVPPPPPFLNEAGWNFGLAVAPLVEQWMRTVQPKAPWIDPDLGFPPGADVKPGQADAVVLGWQFEDAVEGPAETLKRLGVRIGVPVMVFTSTGAWRAGKRRRTLSRRDLEEIFGKEPEYLVHTFSLDPTGNGGAMTTFRFVPDRIGQRDFGRVLRHAAPRQALSVCYMTRNVGDVIRMSLDSVKTIADEVVIADNGSRDDSLQVIEAWAKRTGIPTKIVPATPPLWCWDCLTEHGKGEMHYGHRYAGFETARNESMMHATGDWCFWLDADEELLGPEQMHKYLVPNAYKGYSLKQHHFTCDMGAPHKTDLPVRVFRMHAEGVPGLFDYGPLRWPTVHSGKNVRFAGVVHEHPGFSPGYQDGIGPVIVVSDMHIAHRGYYVEDARRGRFVRNWPLMVSDMLKYPQRRLSWFLWLRDLVQHQQYQLGQAGGQVTGEVAMLASESVRIWNDLFCSELDVFAADALMYATAAAQVLARGIEIEVLLKARKPEVSPGEEAVVTFAGRFDNAERLLGALKSRLGELGRWEGPYL